jgi:methyl-accepting chemotaxis protein
MRDASGQVRSNAENLKQVSDGLKTLVDQFKI